MEIYIISSIAIIAVCVSVWCGKVKSIPDGSYVVLRKGFKTRVFETKEEFQEYQIRCIANNISGRVYRLENGNSYCLGFINTCRA